MTWNFPHARQFYTINVSKSFQRRCCGQDYNFARCYCLKCQAWRGEYTCRELCYEFLHYGDSLVNCFFFHFLLLFNFFPIVLDFQFIIFYRNKGNIYVNGLTKKSICINNKSNQFNKKYAFQEPLHQYIIKPVIWRKHFFNLFDPALQFLKSKIWSLREIQK